MIFLFTIQWNEDPRFVALLGVAVLYLALMNFLLVRARNKLEKENETLRLFIKGRK